MPPSTVWALCSDKIGTLVIQTMGWGAPIWPGSAKSFPLPLHTLLSPPPSPAERWLGMSTDPPPAQATFGTCPGQEDERFELLSSPLVRNIIYGVPSSGWAISKAGGGGGGGGGGIRIQLPCLFLPGPPYLCHPRGPAATTAATWEPNLAPGCAHPHPHPRRVVEAGTPKRARGAKSPAPTVRGVVPASPLLLCPGAEAPHGVGEGWERVSPPHSRVTEERNPVAVTTVSKRTSGCSRPAPAPSLTGALPLLPSLPAVGAGRGAGRGRGPRRRPGPGRGAVRGKGGGPGTVFRPHCLPTGSLPPPRYSRAQASSSSSSSWLRESGAGPADRAPGRGEATAAPGSGLWQRRRLRARGWSCGARARTRTRRVLSPACARAAASRGPLPPTPRGGGDSPGSQRRRLRTHLPSRAPLAQGRRSPRRTPSNRLSGPGICRQTQCTPSAEHTGCSAKQLRSRHYTHPPRSPESRRTSRPWPYCTLAVGRGWSRQVPQCGANHEFTASGPLPLCLQQAYITTCLLRNSSRTQCWIHSAGFHGPCSSPATELSPSDGLTV